MQPLMNGRISSFQNTFINGRLILDNIFLAVELVSFIHKAKRAKRKWCALKMDIRKAYNRITWESVLNVMGFSEFLEVYDHAMCISCFLYSFV